MRKNKNATKPFTVHNQMYESLQAKTRDVTNKFVFI